MAYEAKDYSRLIGMEGFSETLLRNHFTLYQGYVTNTHRLLPTLGPAATDAKCGGTGAMRGIGWAMLYRDNMTGRLINQWINEHEVGHLAGCQPILVMDVFEHAFMIDYGLKRADYIEAFFNNISREAVESRLASHQ